MKGLALILGAKSKGKAAPPSEPEMGEEEGADESEGGEMAEYKKVLAEAGAEGDWDGVAEAVAGMVRCSK